MYVVCVGRCTGVNLARFDKLTWMVAAFVISSQIMLQILTACEWCTAHWQTETGTCTCVFFCDIVMIGYTDAVTLESINSHDVMTSSCYVRFNRLYWANPAINRVESIVLSIGNNSRQQMASYPSLAHIHGVAVVEV